MAGELSAWRRFAQSRAAATLIVALALIALWYMGATLMNADLLERQYARSGGQQPTTAEFIRDAWSLERPVLPAPHQVAAEIFNSTVTKRVTSKRSLVYHAYKTLAPTVLGFLFGVGLGALLAIGIIYNRMLEKSLMPWIVISQTIPILAIAPMIIVVLGAINFTGVVPKAFISMYLSFFPAAIGMVKGLRSPDPLQMDLMRTYSASPRQIFFKLRVPSSLPFVFAGLKVAAAVSLVGAIVGELPTGAQGGLGARLLVGSYYGQTIQIWAALMVAAFLGAMLVFAVDLVKRLVMRSQQG